MPITVDQFLFLFPVATLSTEWIPNCCPAAVTVAVTVAAVGAGSVPCCPDRPDNRKKPRNQQKSRDLATSKRESVRESEIVRHTLPTLLCAVVFFRIPPALSLERIGFFGIFFTVFNNKNKAKPPIR